MFGASPTDERKSPFLPIYQFEPRRPVHVLAVSTLEGLYTHFVGRTRACPGSTECRLCEIGRAQRYHGYFAAVIEKRRYLVRLTAGAALRLLAHPPEPGTVYRAESASVRRPLDLSAVGAAEVPPRAIVSQLELVGLLMGLHGLGLPDGASTAEALREVARLRAKALIDQEALCFE